MGRSYTPTYRVETVLRKVSNTPAAWHVKGQYGAQGYGKPTHANLHEYIVRLELSSLPGGVNDHLFDVYGYCPVLSARIVRQRDGKVMAEWNRESDRDSGGDTRLAEAQEKYDIKLEAARA